MKDLFAALDTPGCHMVVALFLVVFGCGLLVGNGGSLPDVASVAHEIIGGALAVVWVAMKGLNGGRVTISDPRANPVQPAVREAPKP